METLKKLLLVIIFSIFIFFTTNAINSVIPTSQKQPSAFTASDILLVSTLNGTLYAVHQHTGEVLWNIQHDPILQAPMKPTKKSVFLANPKDGSLYLFKLGQEGLKKLPYTIPDLVSLSPRRTKEGYFYTGYKKDSWISIDLLTGTQRRLLNKDGVHDVCPSHNGHDIFIGKTEYSIVMFDEDTKLISWNITFSDFSSHLFLHSSPHLPRHFASSSSGHLVTLDSDTGKMRWARDLESPVVGIYVLDHDLNLASRAFHTVGVETLQHLDGLDWVDEFMRLKGVDQSDSRLKATLYIGRHSSLVYALPSFVDSSAVVVAPTGFGTPLLEAPKTPLTMNNTHSPSSDFSYHDKYSEDEDYNNDVHDSYEQFDNRSDDDDASNKTSGGLLIGYHEVPAISTDLDVVTWHSKFKQITSSDSLAPINQSNITVTSLSNDWLEQMPIFVLIGWIFAVVILAFFVHYFIQLYSRSFLEFPIDAFKNAFKSHKAVKMKNKNKVKTRNKSPHNKTIPTNEKREEKHVTQNDSSKNSFKNLDGTFTVGKISYDPKQTLGHGSNGTMVYKGSFEGRAVAVKRLLSAYTEVAMQEVVVLKQTDDHANVVRYFCQEQDHQFIYIALELCICTLHDVVKTTVSIPQLSSSSSSSSSSLSSSSSSSSNSLFDINHKDILLQMLHGIKHLHSLNIIHRDIKPQNVLLSRVNGGLRALISDFGFCKKISHGRLSVSKASGIAGTEGWMAAEMLSSDCLKTTQSVDSFSSGCVIFYVLSQGSHPFGIDMDCQSNIMQGRYDLEKLQCQDDKAAKHLVSSLIQSNPHHRMNIRDAIKHPFFWNNSKRLSFFEAVSDWLELLPDTHENVMRLECKGLQVIRFDWTTHVTPLLLQDLIKFRYYNKNSVRDLLRAIRNKRHHFHTLAPELKEVLGPPPDQFIEYFMSRFPSLLMHTHSAMHIFRRNHNLAPYYSS